MPPLADQDTNMRIVAGNQSDRFNWLDARGSGAFHVAGFCSVESETDGPLHANISVAT